MKSYDVVGYTYQADMFCRPCVRSMAAVQAESRGVNSEFVPLDKLMWSWAENVGVDADDESSYDSDDFPKVIFADQANSDDVCGRCGESLVES